MLQIDCAPYGTHRNDTGSSVGVAHNPDTLSPNIHGIHAVPLTLRDGAERHALVLGHNVAWVCACGNPMPLLGSATPWPKERASQSVACPHCKRQYVIVTTEPDSQFARVVESAA